MKPVALELLEDWDDRFKRLHPEDPIVARFYDSFAERALCIEDCAEHEETIATSYPATGNKNPTKGGKRISVSSDHLTYLVYAGQSPLRIIGEPQDSELDGRWIFTPDNTANIHCLGDAKSPAQSCQPGNRFSSYKVIKPGDRIIIKGKRSFSFVGEFYPMAAVNNAGLEVV